MQTRCAEGGNRGQQQATRTELTFIDESTCRADLEIAAIFDCNIDCATVEAASDEALRTMITAWIEAGDECAAA